MSTITWSLQHKRDTAANFTANNPVLLAGQLGIETDGLTTIPKFKIGDGSSSWTALPYFYGGTASAQDLANVLSLGGSATSLDLKNVISDETGSGSLVFGTSPTFVTDISISGAGTNGFKLTSQVGTAANTALYMNAATPSATNYAIIASTTALQINAASDSIYLSIANNPLLGIRGNVTSGTTVPYSFLMPTSTGLTASSEVVSWAVAPHTLDFLAGAKTLQRDYVWGRATYTANTTTTITTAIGHDFYAPLAGSNITITTAHIARFVGANTNSYIREFTSSTSGFSADGNLRLNTDGGSSAAIVLTNGGNSRLQVSNSTIYFNPAAYTSGATETFSFTVPANTGQTASTEIPNFKVTGNTKTWAAGAITTQRWNYFTANTAAFASASTITNSYGLYVEAATAGSNANITNNNALGVSGSLEITSGRLKKYQGADVASANNLVLGGDGNVFEITGTTQVNLISNIAWQNGSQVTLLFTSTPTVKHNQATSTTNITIQLAGAIDFVATAGDTLTLCLCEIGGTQAWREISRAVI